MRYDYAIGLALRRDARGEGKNNVQAELTLSEER
jgi:hypothetical protein